VNRSEVQKPSPGSDREQEQVPNEWITADTKQQRVWRFFAVFGPPG
jgi:hypothetical protein